MNNSDTRREPSVKAEISCAQATLCTQLPRAGWSIYFENMPLFSVVNLFSKGLIFRREKRREVYSMRDCNIDISVYRSGRLWAFDDVIVSLKKPTQLRNSKSVIFWRHVARLFYVRSLWTNKTCTVSFAWLVVLFSDFDEQKLGLILCIPHNGKG